MERDVYPHNPDLIFIDFAINDLYEGYTAEQSKVFMESLITNLQSKYPDADIVMILVTDRSNLGDDYTNLVAHEAIANHYGIPVINVGEALADKCTLGALSWSTYFDDSVHPNDKGYQIYADAITAQLDTLLPASPVKATAHTLPEQYMSNLLEGSKLVTADKIGAQTGWTLVTERTDATDSVMGYGRLSSALVPTAGATLTYTFNGSAFGMLVEPGSSQNVTITIDGILTATMTENSSEEKITKVIFDNLADCEHTVEITYGGSGAFSIGAFLIG